MGILGETETVHSKHIKICQTTISEGFGFVSQDCWLRRGSIRDNIVCGSPFRQEFYTDVLRATALEYDISIMPNGDNHLIGDDGTILSGGQRARLALARAIYQNNDVILLDDPFASLDIKVADFVYENCIEKMLKEKGKAVILCTHHTKYLKHADYVIQINEVGGIENAGRMFFFL